VTIPIGIKSNIWPLASFNFSDILSFLSLLIFSELNSNLATQSQVLTLQNGWTAFNGLKIYKTGNVCNISGILYAGAVGVNTTLASLPQGFIPTTDRYCAVSEIETAVSTFSITKTCPMVVKASGQISILGGFTASNRYDVNISYVI
jgi:hypothetical protein